MKTQLIHSLVAIASLLAPLTGMAASPVEMITDTEELQPASTLEFRFISPMVEKDDMGIPLAMDQVPIAISPAVDGRFTWLSRSSGVFAPSQPWPLGTTFAITLRPRLADAAGKKLAGDFRASTRTPDFQQTYSNGTGYETCDPAPTIVLAYNLPVDLASTQNLFRFVSDEGTTIAARVAHATREDYIYIRTEHDDWEKRWREAQGAAEEQNPDREAPIPSRLRVEPVTPLTPGTWRLEIKPGITSLGGSLRIAKPSVSPLGKVLPFDILQLRPDNFIKSGRVLTVEFTHRLAPDITPDVAGASFRIEPAVANLAFEGWSDTLIARGDFETGKDYRFIVGDDVISAHALPFVGEKSLSFRFAPAKPRLYLPQITASQIQGGQRKLDVLSGNLASIKVIARLVNPEDAAAAIDAFAKYQRDEPDYENDEFYQPLPAYTFRSERIAELLIPVAEARVDAKQTTAIDWNRILGDRRTGVIFITVEGDPLPSIGGPRPAAQMLIQLTDLGVMWKKIASGLQVTAFSMESGKPLDGVSVTFLDKEFKPTRKATTGADGIATPAWAEQSEWMLFRKGDDTHALRIGMAADELPMYAFNVPIDYAGWLTFEEKVRPMRSLLFTDRPLYRPGETVKVKGILRDLTETEMSPAIRCEAALVLRDARGRTILTTDVTTDERGAFDTEIPIGSSFGAHSLVLEIPDAPGSSYRTGFSTSFLVADFQPDAFELAIDVPDRIAPGATASAALTGRYFFGAPVDRADVRWTLTDAREYVGAYGFYRWDFIGADESNAALTLRGEGKLTAGAPFVISPQLPAAASNRRVELTVEVTDVNQQTVSTRVGFSRDAADFQLGTALPEGRVGRVGEDLPVQVIAVRADGKPLDQPVALEAELIHRRFETVRVRGAGNAISFRTETVEESIARTSGNTLVPTLDNGYWRVADGHSLSFRIARVGAYHIKLTARDAAGRAVVNTMPIYVSGNDEVAWDYRNPAHVDLIPDKSEYSPGDTARILVKAPISGEALVTVERGERIVRRMQVSLEGNAPEIQIPLEAADAPNVFVSLMLIRGREDSPLQYKMPGARYGLTMLRVRDPDAHLEVAVTPASPEVRPGSDLDVEVHVRNENGKPIADAEVILYAPDDGILSITGFEKPDPASVFHAPFPLAIRTGLTLFDLLPEDPEALEFSNKGYLIGGGGDAAGPGLRVRKDFPGTAAWLPRLRTDAAGIARATLIAPDALTRYRLVAVAHSAGKAFGSGESSFTIRQPLMILPALGQAAHVGDEIQARAVVRNESGRDGQLTLTLGLDATAQAASSAPLQRTVPLASGASVAVDFPVSLVAMGRAEWSWSADLATGDGTRESDSAVSRLTIGSAAPLLRETYLTEAAAGSSLDLLAGVNPQLLEGSGEVSVTLSNTRLATLRESATQLLEYPYGCAEQVISGLIPWMLADVLKPVIPQLGGDADANEVVRQGLDRLFAMQTTTGGISYWPGRNENSLFASAYAAIACSIVAENEMIPVPAGLTPLLEYLSLQLRENARISHEDRALVLFALSACGRDEPAYHEALYKNRKELSAEARAWLAMAILSADGPQTMVATLLDPKSTAPESISWFGGAARDRAVQLMAWTLHKPRSPEVAKLVKELLGLRLNGHWATTQQNAWALMALAAYYKSSEQGSPDIAASLVSAAGPAAIRLDARTRAATRSFDFSPTQAPGPLTATHARGGMLFGESLFVVRPPVAKQPAQNRGYAVSRTYQKLAPDGSLTAADSLKVGDRLVVTLRVETVRPGHFVAIDDPLPAILEAVNPAFASRAVGDGPQDRDWVSDHREVRADRVLYFCDHLSPGSYTFRYLARVRMAGIAQAGPTKVEEMYRPERFGLSASGTLTSTSADD